MSEWIYRSDSKTKKKVLLYLTITLQLFLLVYFKYAYFFAGIASDFLGREVPVMNHFAWIANNIPQFNWFDVDTILLPVGISFFTFQVITYVVDVSKGKLDPVRSFTDYAFYISFFPPIGSRTHCAGCRFYPAIVQ